MSLQEEWGMTLPVAVPAQQTDRHSPLLSAADRLVRRVEVLVDEEARLQSENAAMRREAHQAVALMDPASIAATPRG
jgi:hypothetical protein